MQLPKHSTCAAPRARPGFTLVELMVVIAIIGVVAALATSAALQVVARQKANNTDLTIRKVSDALQAHWKAVVDQAKNELIPDNILNETPSTWGLLAMAGGDAKRARVIWIKLRLKQQFPMNFMEALNPTPSAIKGPGGKPYVLLAPAPVFVQALQGQPTFGEPQIYESSVCLLLALSQARKGVAAFNQDRFASTELADSGVGGLKAIVDAWGRPLVFYRWPGWSEKGEPPTEIAASNPDPHRSEASKQIVLDPLDPDALLMDSNWNSTINYQNRGGIWAFEKLFHPLHQVPGYFQQSFFTVPVVASAGPDAGEQPLLNGRYVTVYDLMGLLPPLAEKSPPALPPLPPALRYDRMDLVGKPQDPITRLAITHGQDNIYSFRMRLGARGD